LGLKTYINNVTIIGDNTYGKGVGQLVFEDKSRKLMVFLVNHFWNVREQNIKETGITPDIHIISDDLNDYLDIIKVK
jgi:C-terminal processing protease CtpA/Prc